MDRKRHALSRRFPTLSLAALLAAGCSDNSTAPKPLAQMPRTQSQAISPFISPVILDAEQVDLPAPGNVAPGELLIERYPLRPIPTARVVPVALNFAAPPMPRVANRGEAGRTETGPELNVPLNVPLHGPLTRPAQQPAQGSAQQGPTQQGPFYSDHYRGEEKKPDRYSEGSEPTVRDRFAEDRFPEQAPPGFYSRRDDLYEGRAETPASKQPPEKHDTLAEVLPPALPRSPGPGSLERDEEPRQLPPLDEELELPPLAADANAKFSVVRDREEARHIQRDGLIESHTLPPAEERDVPYERKQPKQPKSFDPAERDPAEDYTAQSQPAKPKPALSQPGQPSPTSTSVKTVQRGPQPINPQMQAVIQRATQLVRHASSLAQRGAYYSARAELIESLRLVSQALDAQEGSQRHSQSLAAGIRALEEVADFMPRGARLEGDMDLKSIASGHRTPVIREDATLLSRGALGCTQAYLSFAEAKLSEAGGNLSVASAALYGLGRMQQVTAGTSGVPDRLVMGLAMTLHQAALTVDSRNFQAANELGVILVQFGQLDDARQVLVHAATLAPQPTTWHNLAVVHRKQGQEDLARRAENEAKLASRQGVTTTASGTQIEWVDGQAFARDSANERNVPSAAQRPTSTPKR